MYFSKISLRPGQERSAAGAAAHAPGEAHHWLWRWFPSSPGMARDFVFRRHDSADRGDVAGAPVYYVVSARPPLAELDAWTARSRPYAPSLAAGTALDFELRANPTVRPSLARNGLAQAEASRQSPRHDVVMNAKQKWVAEAHPGRRWNEVPAEARPSAAGITHTAGRAWLERCGERNGFEPDTDSLRVDGYRQHRMAAGRDGTSGRAMRAFSSVDFVGRLTVIEPAAFGQALLQGVGRARAFGCGLILVRRAA